MRARQVIVSLVVLALLLVPALGFAADDLSASPIGKHHGGRLHHQPHRGWRTVPSTLAPPPPIPAATRGERVSLVDTVLTTPPLARAPFVPPRG
ncbi:MAG TPA: hypothetical protein VGM22_14000 [Methylomirabilota bacterium]|jgi:hypothetical protein